jgi:glutathione S-transferase
VDLKNKPKDLLESNPYGKVPVLVDEGDPIYESSIINQYLEEKYPALRLMPEDLKQRARVRIWMDYCDTRLHATASEIMHGAEPETAKGRLKKHLAVVERELETREYIAANDYTLADITFIPFFVRRERYRFDLEDLPRTRRWLERMLVRPAVAPTL